MAVERCLSVILSERRPYVRALRESIIHVAIFILSVTFVSYNSEKGPNKSSSLAGLLRVG